MSTLLRFYAGADRDLTEDLITQAFHAEGGHLVSRLVKCHIGPEFHVWEDLFERIGLDPLEASWEPATVILEDLPKAFVQHHPTDDSAKSMWRDLMMPEPSTQRGRKKRR